MTQQAEYRTERDSLGEYRVPADVWYGVQTARAVDNFPISGRRPDRHFVLAHVQVKRAAAAANHRGGWLDEALTTAIIEACDRILGGEHLDQFVVDRFQAGAGTSHNMNSNEVIANLANVALGGERGRYTPVHPNDHVNMGQSTNDTIPTAIRLAALAKLPALTGAVRPWPGRWSASPTGSGIRSRAAAPTCRMRSRPPWAGSSTPMPGPCAAAPRALARHVGRRCARSVSGGSAAGTGLNTAPDYAPSAAAELARLTGESIRPAADLAAQMQSMHDLQRLSSAIRDLALELTRIANDMRLLASGPRTGLGEIRCRRCSPARASCRARSIR